MEALYDGRGIVVGFRYDHYLVNLNGKHVAFIQNGSVYSYTGNYLGRWRGGHMRGRDGGVVVWHAGAANLGVVAPVPSVPPVPPVPAVPPVPPVPSVPPVAPVDLIGWSAQCLF